MSLEAYNLHIANVQTSWASDMKFPSAHRAAASLIEVLVVIAIIAVLVGMIIPAVQQVAAAAARVRCQNNLRQLGIAFHQHYLVYGRLPSNGGWDGTQTIETTTGAATVVSVTELTFNLTFIYGVGDPSLSPDDQAGSWAFTLLPQLEQNAMFSNRSWTNALSLFVCPSRRQPVARVAQNDANGIYQTGGWTWGPTDYAGNYLVTQSRPNPATPAKCLDLSEFTDGTSTTILAGEKAMNPINYKTGTWYWDEPFFVGGSGGTTRGFGFLPGEGTTIIRDDPNMGYLYRYNWGSAHPNGAHFLMADGSVRPLNYSTTNELVQALLTPNGGEVVPDDF